MLVSFTIENFLSFKERSTLTLVPDALKENKEYLHIPYLYDINARLLKSVSIYGHNSHGKSNFIKAYKFFHDLILDSADQNRDEIIDIDVFRLSTVTANKPSYFEAVFYIKETKYRYGFQVTSKNVVEEWLYYSEAKVRDNYLFHRYEDDTKLSKNWVKLTGGLVDRAVHFTRPHQLLLSSLMSSKQIPDPIDKLSQWFKGNMIISDIAEEKYFKFALMILSQEEYRPLINRLIDYADLGFSTIIEKIDSHLKNKISLEEDILRVWFNAELKDFSLFTKHNFYDEEYKLIDTVSFEFLKDESAGTQRFLVIACLISYAIKRGHLILIDEIDSRFHALLLVRIILFYHSPKINVLGSQMIFTTHNTVLLDEIMRRDQILFVEKNSFGESKLLKGHSPKTPIRIDSSIERDYRRGKLGGVSDKLKRNDDQTSLDFS